MTQSDAVHNGIAAFRRRDFAAAEHAFAIALAGQPGDRNLRFNLAMVYEATSRWELALELYAEIVAGRPDDVDAWIRIGIVRYVQARYREACVAFASALRSAPSHPLALLNFGIAAILAGESGDAVRVLRDGVERQPERAELWAVYGDALRVAARPDEAQRAAERALALDPQSVEAQVVIGQLAYARGAFGPAERAFAAAERAAPQRFEPVMNLGVLAHGLGQTERALGFCRRAVALAPGEPDAHVNLGMSLLLAGDASAGFAELEWRRRIGAASEREAQLRSHGLRPWDGAPTEKLVVVRDQGLGDWVAWSRLFPRLPARAEQVVLAVPAALRPLYQERPAATAIVGEDEVVAGPGSYVPVCSLPVLLGGEPGVGAAVPYLRAEPERTTVFREAFERLGRPAVGLVWAGEPSHRLDRFRSCPLDALAPLAGLDVTWVSLQVGARAADVPPPGLELLVPDPPLTDFAATAAALAALDLVVAVDTAVAHVAGALGRPVWTIHGFGHYWMWGVGRRDSPWYPSMRLFRQTVPGRWDELVAELRAELAHWLAQARSVGETERT